MLGESLRVPFRADDWIGTILVGSVLTLLIGLFVGIWALVLLASPAVGGALFAVVALPSLVLRGYLVGVVRSGIRSDSTAASFVRWGSLLQDGTRSVVISVVYLIPAAILCGLALGGAIATVVSPEGFEGTVQAITAAVILIGGFGLLLYGLVYLYIRPAARAVFASTGSVRAALRVRRVLRLSGTADYITGWLIGMGILVVGPTLLIPLVAVSLALGLVSPGVAFVGLLLTVLCGICLTFVCRVSAAWATGRGSAAGLEQLYPAAFDTAAGGVTAQPVSSVDDDGRPGVPVEDYHPPEAPVSVQTGRSVGTDSQSSVSVDHAEPMRVDHAERVAAADARNRARPRRLATGEFAGAPIRPRRTAIKPQITEPRESDPQPTDNEPQTEDEFVWGPENHE